MMLGFGETEVAKEKFYAAKIPILQRKCKPFTVISINSLLVYENKYYLQAYSDNRAYKVIDN